MNATNKKSNLTAVVTLLIYFNDLLYNTTKMDTKFVKVSFNLYGPVRFRLTSFTGVFSVCTDYLSRATSTMSLNCYNKI